MDIYVAEYSITQNAFNVDLLSESININIQNSLKKNYTDYQIIGIGTYEQCSKACNELKSKLDKQPKIIKENVMIKIDGKTFTCKCGANLFSQTEDNNYICQDCKTVYK